MAEAIYTNDNYTVVRAERTDGSGHACYHLVSLLWGVVELEHSLLPEILQAADFYNEKLIQFGRSKQIEEQAKEKAKPAIVT